MEQLNKYPVSNRPNKRFGGRPIIVTGQDQTNVGKKYDHKDIIAKAIKQASLKTELLRAAASDTQRYKLGRLDNRRTEFNRNSPTPAAGSRPQTNQFPSRNARPVAGTQQNQSRFASDVHAKFVHASGGIPSAGGNARRSPDTQKPGGDKKKRSKDGGRGAFNEPQPRMSTYKNKPRLKTGTDKDTLGREERLKIMVLGGNEEVGRNMTMFEYKNDILLLDMGLQFPEDDMPGVDYIIPNTSYITDNNKIKNIRGVIISHAHLDHIGAIPHLAPRLGNPPFFMNALTAGIVKKRQDDFRSGPPIKINIIKSNDVLQLGSFKVEFFRVSHNIPDSFGVIITTPAGIVVHTGDFKIDTNPSGDLPTEIDKIRALGSKNVLALMADSTNASIPGHQLTEGDIQHNIDDIINNAKSRVIIGTFSSMLGRIQQIIWACERCGRKVAIEGFSMKSNVAIAQELGYMKIQKGTLIETKQALKLPDDKVVFICTGAQGEDRAALMRIANGDHPMIQVEQGDTVVFSSSVIPGNERSVQRLKDTLYREGAEVVHYQMLDVHAGGHARQEDLKLMHDLVKPKYLIPIEGNHSFLRLHAKAAMENGFKKENIFIADNGQIMEFDLHGHGILTNRKVPTEYVFVDGLGVGDTNQVILRDRKELSSDGLAIVFAVVSGQTGKMLKMPEIITRGFASAKDSDLMSFAKRKVAATLKDHDPRSSSNAQYLRDKIRDDLGQLFFTKTGRRPMILPLVIEV
ncbi:MAG: ribonuclease J [Patescibacteria group bacterium]